MTVHNHGPAEGPGLSCPERRTPIGGYLRGACLPDPVEPEPYCDHGPFDACRCLAIPVWKLPAAGSPASRLEQLSGVQVQKTLPATDRAAAIITDQAGKFLGYVTQSEVDRVRNLPAPETILRAAGRILQMIEAPPAEQPAPADAEDMHVYAHEFDPIGGFVCSECGTPTESEPCRDHQPDAYSKIT